MTPHTQGKAPAHLSRSTIALVLFGIVAVYTLSAANIDVADIDQAQYASISLEMLQNGEYLEVQHRHSNYIDKPPFLFWSSALSFHLFGASHFTYRLPTLLSTLLALFAVFRLGALYYNRRTGLVAMLMLASSQAYFLHHHDVRTDTLLANAVITAVWLIASYLRSGKLWQLLLGSVAVAVAMLQKGPIGLMVPLLAFAADLFYHRRWAVLLRWHWSIALAVIAVALSPMCVGLYLQYDADPQSSIYGVKGASGLRFYFWDQSFGRLTGSNPFVKKSSGSAGSPPWFFVAVFFWMFVPWMLLTMLGLYRRILEVWRAGARTREQPEIMTYSAFVLTLLALSFSQFKLPHYLLVILPFAAIISARAVDHLLDNLGTLSRAFVWIQAAISLAIWGITVTLCVWCFPLDRVFLWCTAGSLFVLGCYFLWSRHHLLHRLLLPALLASMGCNFLLASHFFPQVMQYHSGSSAARYVIEQQIPTESLAMYKEKSHALEFYVGDIVLHMNRYAQLHQEMQKREQLWLYTSPKGLRDIGKMGLSVDRRVEFLHYHVTKIRGVFLNPDTRDQLLRKRYLVLVSRP